MKVFALLLVLLAPVLLWAWPQPGDPAPNISVPDTAWQTHILPAEYRGHVVQLFFWQST
ncbi:MAG: hypothetical protein ACP5JB_07610 [candidate division WOR-3 bacterium]|jgi:peroxiredoxin